MVRLQGQKVQADGSPCSHSRARCVYGARLHGLQSRPPGARGTNADGGAGSCPVGVSGARRVDARRQADVRLPGVVRVSWRGSPLQGGSTGSGGAGPAAPHAARGHVAGRLRAARRRALRTPFALPPEGPHSSTPRSTPAPSIALPVDAGLRSARRVPPALHASAWISPGRAGIPGRRGAQRAGGGRSTRPRVRASCTTSPGIRARRSSSP